MSRKEIIQSVSTILELFLEVVDIIENQDIQRGYATEFSTKQGVLIRDTITDEYNFYTYEQYKALWELAIEISKFRKDVVGIESRYTHTLCVYCCNSIIDIVDRLLLDELLFPILSHLLGESSNKNRYIINIYYTS